MLHLSDRHRVVLDPEVGDAGMLAAEIGDQGIVGVEQKPGAVAGAREDARPPIGDRFELAIAIELIPEQVGEEDRAWTELRDHRL